MVKAATPARRLGVNISAEVVDLVERAQRRLVGHGQGSAVSVLATIGALAVLGRPKDVGDAIRACSIGSKPGPLAVGEAIAERTIAAPVALPDGWDVRVEPPTPISASSLDLFAPGARFVARVSAGELSTHGSPDCSPSDYAAAVAYLVALAGGAS